MTERDHIPQEDLALYAMQALPAEEAAAVRAHSGDMCRVPCRVGCDFGRSGGCGHERRSARRCRKARGERFLNRISADATSAEGRRNPASCADHSGAARAQIACVDSVGRGGRAGHSGGRAGHEDQHAQSSSCRANPIEAAKAGGGQFACAGGAGRADRSGGAAGAVDLKQDAARAERARRLPGESRRTDLPGEQSQSAAGEARHMSCG